jgi:hypothetical protein
MMNQTVTTMPINSALTGYVIKHCEEYIFFADDSGTTTDDFDKAAIYSSRLAAHQRCSEFWKRLPVDPDNEEQQEWQIIKRKLVEIKPKKLEAPFALAISDPLEAIQKVYEYHCMYSQRVSDWMYRAGVKDVPRPPICKITITAPKWAGIYMPKVRECHYPIVYVMMHSERESFEETIAHEVVHAYQNAFSGFGGGHGPDFFALMRHAAQYPATSAKHTYDLGEAKRLSEKLREWWKEQGERGALASLPVEVITQPMKRQGIVCQ